MKRVAFVNVARRLRAYGITGLLVGCASTPQYQPPEAPSWDEVVQIRKQKLMEARAGADSATARCRKSNELRSIAFDAVSAAWHLPKADFDKVGIERVLTVRDQRFKESNIACQEADKAVVVLEREENMYAGMLRVMEKEAYPPRIDVYHY